MQDCFRIEHLPAGALDASAAFHADHLPAIRARLAHVDAHVDALAIVFPAAPHDHRAWRLAAVQDLARAHAPRRVNGIAGEDADAIAATLAWLATAPGVTGQLLGVHGHGQTGGHMP